VAYQYRIRSLVSGNWAKEVDISNLTISSWTKEQDESWISNLPDIMKPPDEGFDASTLESVAYLERKKEWDQQYGALLQIAKNHKCDLMPVISSQG
jgi:hypothetical protein